MDKQIAIDLIGILSKSQDKNAIYKALVKLRTDWVKDSVGIRLFYEYDGIRPLVRLIRKPYEKILEVALSILGNCCTNKDCSELAISVGILSPLLTILKSIPNSMVQCRACRLIGNLARETDDSAFSTIKGLGIALSSALDDNLTNLTTLAMAIRAIRLLWSNSEFRKELIKYGGIKKIIEILVNKTKCETKIIDSVKIDSDGKSCDESLQTARINFLKTYVSSLEFTNSVVYDAEILKDNIDSDEEFQFPDTKELNELVLEIFRCLITVTNGMPKQFLTDFSYPANGNACHCLAFFAKCNSPLRAQALKILSNLSIYSGLFINTHAVHVACHLITNQHLEQPLSESEQRHCIDVICFLSGEVCHRPIIRVSGALRKLLEILTTTDRDDIIFKILIGLKEFRFDNQSMDRMIQMGLVGILIRLLSSKITEITERHIRKSKSIDLVAKVKRNAYDECAVGEFVGRRPKRVRIEDHAYSILIPKEIPSPVSPLNLSELSRSFPSSPGGSSSGHSPKSMSPRPVDEEYEAEEVDYSPVCSDIEDNVDDDTSCTKEHRNDEDEEQLLLSINGATLTNDQPIEGVDEMKKDEDDTNESQDSSTTKKSDSNCNKAKIIQIIIAMLRSTSYRSKHCLDLCEQESLTTLIKCCRLTYQRRSADSAWNEHGAPHILSRIVSETLNFVPLLKYDFVYHVYELTIKTHDDCYTCDDLEYVGQGLLDQLNEMAETTYCYSEIVRLVTRINEHRTIVMVSFILNSHQRIKELYADFNALHILLDIILTSTDSELAKMAAAGLTIISNSLGIELSKPKMSISELKTLTFNESIEFIDRTSIDPTNIVTFLVANCNSAENDAADRIEFDREILIKFSDVFNRMLCSDFKESNANEIQLNNQSVGSIKYFLTSILQISKQQPLYIPTPDMVDVVLKTYDLSKMYMLDNVSSPVLDMIIYLLSSETVMEIFRYSNEKQIENLFILSINYYLSGRMAGNDKVRIFRDAAKSDYFTVWYQALLDTVRNTFL